MRFEDRVGVKMRVKAVQSEKRKCEQGVCNEGWW